MKKKVVIGVLGFLFALALILTAISTFTKTNILNTSNVKSAPRLSLYQLKDLTPDALNNSIYEHSNSLLRYFYSFSLSQILSTILLSLTALALYLYYSRQMKPNHYNEYYHDEYYKELPGDYSPAQISILMDSWIEVRDISATLLDLVRRKHLVLEEDKESTQILFFKTKEIKNYVILRSKESNGILKSHEEFIVDWFLNDLGSSGRISFLDIQERMKDDLSIAQEFSEKFSQWKNLIKDEAIYMQLIQDRFYCRLPSTMLILYIVLCIFLVAFSFLNIIPVVIITILLSSTRKTGFGVEQYHKWKAFKRYLKDFSKLNEKIPIEKWEQYFVYAIPLGVAKDVIENLKAMHTPEHFENESLTFLNNNSFIFNDSYMIFDKYIKEINSTAKSSVKEPAPIIEEHTEEDL